MGKWLARYWPALVAGSLCTTLSFSFKAELRLREAQIEDHFIEARGAITPPSEVVIVAIDDYSLQQAANSDMSRDVNLHGLGQWPWPRRYYGQVIERLMKAGASIVALDLVFDTESSHGANDDKAFAEIIEKYSARIVLSSHALESQGSVAGLSIREPVVELLAALRSKQIGIINALPDVDGSIRQRPSEYLVRLSDLSQGSPIKSLAEVVINTYEREANKKVSKTDLAKESKRLRYYGPPRSIQTIPIWSLLEGNSYSRLKNSKALYKKIALVGPTAQTMQDRHKTAFSGSEGMPGVEIHGTEISNRLDGKSIKQIGTNEGWPIVLGFIVLVFTIALERADRPLTRIGWTITCATILGITSYLLVTEVGKGIEITTVGAGVMIGGLLSTAQATATLQINRMRLRRSLERYLSPAVASEVIRRDEREKDILTGKSTKAVIILTDIRGFTAYTQKMSSEGKAKEAVTRLNAYFEKIINIAHKYGGTIDKFIGDSALIVFGAPINRGAQVEAEAAVRCAVEICEALDSLNMLWSKEGLETWRQVVAMTFGEVVSGNVGSAKRMDYTVIGDAVNAASRLESIAKQLDVEILMNEPLADLCKNDNRVESRGQVQLRGQGNTIVFSLIRQPKDINQKINT